MLARRRTAVVKAPDKTNATKRWEVSTFEITFLSKPQNAQKMFTLRYLRAAMKDVYTDYNNTDKQLRKTQKQIISLQDSICVLENGE